jgi:GH15 family glucan-1,4-alpha-glucosidase
VAVPGLDAYAVVSDCHTAALVGRDGTVPWWCVPRFDNGSVFGALLDAERGGECRVTVDGAPAAPVRRGYRDGTLVLETRLRGDAAEIEVTDALELATSPSRSHCPALLRVVECGASPARVELRVRPRFDYGAVDPWIRTGPGGVMAIGGDDALSVWTSGRLEVECDGVIVARAGLSPGERLHLRLGYHRPEERDGASEADLSPAGLDRHIDGAAEQWRAWSARLRFDGPRRAAVVRSALMLKALTYEPTGAIAAAATTSLPERVAGRTWDYRYSWIRDAVLAARSLARLGAEPDADAFRRFVERSAAGTVRGVQVLYGVGGERRLGERQLALDGWRGCGPVRIGNGAAEQLQLDAYGQLVEQSWRWCERGRSPDADYWTFVRSLVDAAAARWSEPDAGLWEWRGPARHFVHSKAHCWAALDRGLRLAAALGDDVPEARWRQARDDVRAAIEARGYDGRRGVYKQAFDHPELDAALLRLPTIGYVDWDDPRMRRTTDAIAAALQSCGLLYRYREDDGLPGTEGVFLACSFWLAECLARQRRRDAAVSVFDATVATANDVGVFSEEYDPHTGEMVGNLPQALTHLSHIEAAIAISESAAD